MRYSVISVICVSCLMLSCMSCKNPARHGRVATVKQEQQQQPPPAPREFRGVWVATVSNIDWPSKPGLTTKQQQDEAVAILDRAKELNLNAIVLQVRPAADALYASEYEPWSWFLTGEQGKAPEPFYDPLKYWIDEAHKRGLELHAWFNPYRARQGGAKYESHASHVSKRNPKIVREFNNWQWLDPAEPEAQEQTYNVFMDVVQRYDVDGIHIDDYFYPYPDYLTKDKVVSDFPDDAPWQRYQQSGGGLARDDWRRDNVDRLIQRIYNGTKSTKRHVKFGISPFGIGRPDEMKPRGIAGFSQYDKLYANAELWLNNGWLDYWTPQLYWKTTATSQPYKGLLDYWVEQNRMQRHVWPGLFTSKVGDPPTAPTTRPADMPWNAKDILDQIQVTRDTTGAGGVVHFSMKVLMSNRGGIADALKNGPYATQALVPATPWLDDRPPPAPRVRVEGSRAAWSPALGAERPWQYAVWTKRGDAWQFAVMPGSSDGIDLSGASAVCVSAVDRCGNESKRVTVTTAK